jgi:hypothetical protein
MGNDSMKYSLYIIPVEGKILDNVTIYPMLRYSDILNGTYVPYAMTNKELTDLTNKIIPNDASASNKLVATNAIYKTLNRSWNETGNRFIKLSNAYPTIGLRTNNYIVSCRNGETYLLLCGTTDSGYTVAPKVYLLYGGTGKLTTNGFYYDSTTNEIAFMTQGYNNVSVTQISGEVKDIILSEISETNPLSNPVAITPQKLVTESDINTVTSGTATNTENVTDGTCTWVKKGSVVVVTINSFTPVTYTGGDRQLATGLPKPIAYTVWGCNSVDGSVHQVFSIGPDGVLMGASGSMQGHVYYQTMTYLTND